MSEAKKNDDGKTRMDLLSPWALEQIAKALQFGAAEYGDYNYREGFEYNRLYGSMLRHTLSWWSGEDLDPKSGLSHLAHVGANVCMLLDHVVLRLGEDNRWGKK